MRGCLYRSMCKFSLQHLSSCCLRVVANNFGWNRGSDFGERSLVNVSGGWLPRLTILPYHPLLVSLADIEGLLQPRLTARSQQAPPCGRHQRASQVSASVAVAEALEVACRSDLICRISDWISAKTESSLPSLSGLITAKS